MDSIGSIAQAFSTVGQTGASLYAGSQATKAGKLSYDSEIQAAQYNANIENLKGEKTISQQRAVIAASGLSTKSGSPLDLMMESAYRSEQNQQAILYGGQTRGAETVRANYLQGKRWAFGAATGAVTGGASALGDWWAKGGGKDWWNSSASAPELAWATSIPSGRFSINS